MIDTTTSVVATGAIVAAGRWAQGKTVSVNIVVGAGVLALGLAVLDSANSDFASKMALMVLLAAVFMYAIPLSTKLGFSGSTKKARTII